jgi:uncharacterized protein YggE
MSSLGSRAGIVTIALLSILTATLAVVVVVDSGGGPSQAGSPTAGRTISVSGAGTVQGVPDTLTARFRVHDRASAVQDALDAANSHARQVMAALHRQGVAQKDMQTADLSLDTSYDEHGRPDGYEAAETLSVRVHPVDHVGRILAAAATAAGNSVSIDGLSFDITHDNKLIDAARSKAFAEAKDAATQDATLAGEDLGQVVSVKETTEGSSMPVPQPYFAAADSAVAAKSIAIRPGQQPVTVRLAVVWELQ